MSAPERPTINATAHSDLFHKAVAVRTQLQLHDVESQMHIARAELAAERGRALQTSLPPLEMQLLAALDAPPGARFNWATFSYDDPPAEGQPPAREPAWRE